MAQQLSAETESKEHGLVGTAPVLRVCINSVCGCVSFLIETMIIAMTMKGTKVLTLGAGRKLYACVMRGTIIRIMRMRIAN